jgi:protein gp37
MADRTSIEWTDATWTPVKGCSRVSEGCRNCYAEVMAARFNKPGQWGEGLAKIVETPQGKDHRWTGAVRFDEAGLIKPLRWRSPRRVFVCSTADLFHESVPDEWIDRVFAVMALCPQHTFQVLTKRSGRMRDYCQSRFETEWGSEMLCEAIEDLDQFNSDAGGDHDAPLPNVWLGVSVEDQQRADERIPDLLATLAAVRWISAEPLLGPISIIDAMWARDHIVGLDETIDWVVVGGESGSKARPMHPDWARSLRDQCAATGVPFFFKQWGDWVSVYDRDRDDPEWNNVPKPGDWNRKRWLNLAGGQGFHGDKLNMMRRVGKKRAGRLLDGVEHNAMPELASSSEAVGRQGASQ